jgi:hypothetical protein
MFSLHASCRFRQRDAMTACSAFLSRSADTLMPLIDLFRCRFSDYAIDTDTYSQPFRLRHIFIDISAAID